MKRLFSGPTNSLGISHHEVTKVFGGQEGGITNHDNLLEYGVDEKEHNRNRAAKLERAKRKGVTMKQAKSKIRETNLLTKVVIKTLTGKRADDIDGFVTCHPWRPLVEAFIAGSRRDSTGIITHDNPEVQELTELFLTLSI